MVLIRTTQSGHFAFISKHIENLTPNKEPKILVLSKENRLEIFYNNDIQNTKGVYWDIKLKFTRVGGTTHLPPPPHPFLMVGMGIFSLVFLGVMFL